MWYTRRLFLWYALVAFIFHASLEGAFVRAQQGGISPSTSSASSTSTSTSASTSGAAATDNPSVSIQISTVTYISTLISTQVVTTGVENGGGLSSSTSGRTRSTATVIQTVPPLVVPTASSGFSNFRIDPAAVLSLAAGMSIMFALF
ncbi:hypothetical protein M408DRAFT_328148 [Serendipita vermifera MAFF 305830]|uniref:Uncharacterized protein n=1 Tax=Serendipita vermifera MAFF 305830 TaxID=933852 RepID=A0A0C3B1F5_SERVB|nr:hypothetical protein M408DRAFT_328148 [Serendipita vermifera MAFF 305830]